MLAFIPVAHFTGAIINDLAVCRREVQWKHQLNFWGSVKEVTLHRITFGLQTTKITGPAHATDIPTPRSHHIRKVIILLARGEAKRLLCLHLLGLKNLGGMEAVHASGLALAFGSELITPWLPELLFGCRSLPGSPDAAGIAQR